MAVIDGGSSSAGKANVDANFNLQVNLPATAAQAGFVVPRFELDAGVITGSRYLRGPAVSEDLRLSTGVDSVLALYNFTATAQNTGDFYHQFLTMTMTQSAGFLNINPALATVSGNYAALQSWKHFSLQGDGGLHYEITQQFSAVPAANQIYDFGLFRATAGVAPVDGVFFRYTSAGLVGIISYNGVETSTGVLTASLPINTNLRFKMLISQHAVEFFFEQSGSYVLGADLDSPAGQAVPYLWLNLPWCVELRNSGTVSGGMIIKVGTTHISQTDLAVGKSWAEQQAGQGGAYQGQDGDAQGSLAIYSNSALAAAAALVNTSAAAQFTGLGGVALVLPTLAAGTDGILFSYQNPVGTVTQPPKTLIIQGITVSAAVQVALTGGPLVLIIGAAFGHTSVSLAVGETASFVTGTTKMPRRVPLGVLSCAVTSAVSVNLGQININFEVPITVNPGEFFAITCRNVATVTSAGALAMVAHVHHYFE